MNRNDQKTAEKIRSRYETKNPTDLDALRALDAKVSRPATVFSYTFGSIAAVIMGAGMSLIMTDIAKEIGLTADPMMTGLIIGAVGLCLSLVNYPLYKAILKSRKKKYAAEILSLSEKIMNQ
jgi:hypothetical protein